MYRLSEAAASDIENILDTSLTAFGALQTEDYYTALTQCLELLGENPEMGTKADDIRPGYRRFPHESHVVFYTIEESGVFIVRILHQHMDAPRNLRDC